MYPVAPVSRPATTAEREAKMIAMVHVHGTTALLNSNYVPLLKVTSPSDDEAVAVNRILGELQNVAEEAEKKFPLISQLAPISKNCRSAIFLLAHEQISALLEEYENLPYVKALIDRAMHEVAIYVKNGVQCVEIENVAAPYFVGSGACPWEELLILHVITRKVRAEYPKLVIGVHILSANELEVLPIAICHGAFFVRSESTLFTGIRPEGPVPNNSNLARFMYMRHQLRTLARCSEDRSPQIWSDCMKKHTVFLDELSDLNTWLHNITFMKLEGVIITGQETGSNVDEKSLALAREHVDKVKAFNKKTYADGKPEDMPELPVITGSGLDFDMYAKYADYIIIGTALKKGVFWENEVDEANVEKTVKALAAANAAAKKQ